MAKKKELAMNLASLDDLFSTQEQREEDSKEKILDISLSEISEFPNHPFHVKMDSEMEKLVESIQQNGVLIPALVRPKDGGGYEMISGHRRKFASDLAGNETIPCIVRNLTDDESTIVMVDSNLQRENLLPSEKAFAYKMKLEAMSRQGQRTDLTSCQVGTKLRADEKLAQSSNESARTVQRFIRLTNLIPALLDMVDSKKIAFNPAVELSYLTAEEQGKLVDTMESEQATPSLSQAQRLKKFSQEGKLTEESMLAIMSEEKKPEIGKVTLGTDTLRKYFPTNWTPKQMEDQILKLLNNWYQRTHNSPER